MLLLFPIASLAQLQPIINSTLKGKIFDSETNQPLSGADVQIKGTTHQVLTELLGLSEEEIVRYAAAGALQ